MKCMPKLSEKEENKAIEAVAKSYVFEVLA